MYRCPVCGSEDTNRSLVGLTAKQRSVLMAIARHQAQHGVSPTVRELGTKLRLTSVSNVHRSIGTLVDRGWLTRRPFASRSLVLTDAAAHYLGRRDGTA